MLILAWLGLIVDGMGTGIQFVRMLTEKEISFRFYSFIAMVAHLLVFWFFVYYIFLR